MFESRRGIRRKSNRQLGWMFHFGQESAHFLCMCGESVLSLDRAVSSKDMPGKS
jgi:hypothetical protein